MEELPEFHLIPQNYPQASLTLDLEAFLSNLRDLQPELCIAEAYGNILPTKFLNIPLHGTVNIHPSLLPLYRGAAPVQRALQDGVPKTGVSLAFTVHKLDAGPVIAFKRFQVDDQINVLLSPHVLIILSYFLKLLEASPTESFAGTETTLNVVF